MPACSDREAIRAYLTRREGSPPEVRETHISWVFLTESSAYKLKKPLVLPFVDYGGVEQRKRMCCEELRLNRRLAPDVYVDVRSVIPDHDGVAFAGLDHEQAIDYVVEMRRYREADTLAARLRNGAATGAQLRRVGARLAEFHASCPARAGDAPVAHAGRQTRAGEASVAHADRQTRAGDAPVAHATERELDRNALELLDLVEDDRVRDRIRTIWRSLIMLVRARAPELTERAGRGLVREVHGDVRAEHILLGDPVEIVDCVEFDPALRTLDLADELSFLVMELTEAGAEELVASLLGGYREAGGDCGDEALVAMFAIHRALVRAKVSFVAAAEVEGERRGQLVTHARRLLEVAERLTWRARQPITLVICGLPASGKSHLAKRLGDRSGLPVLSSDQIRKQLAGVAPIERAGRAHYTPSYNRRTYAELGRRARQALEQAGGALVDATFRHVEDRRAFTAEFGSHWYAVECRAPRQVLRRRSLVRDQDPSRVSDASAAVVEASLGDWSPLDELTADDHLVLRSDRPVSAMLADLTALLDRRLLNGA